MTFIRFVTVGSLCTALNLGFLWIAVEIMRSNYLVATILSFLFINGGGYALHKLFTFRLGKSVVLPELMRYYTGMLGSLIVNLCLMFVLVSIIGLHYLFASILVTLALVAANFTLHKRWTFGLGH
jgi:Predicted membrane protein